MQTNFVDPYTKQALKYDEQGNLCRFLGDHAIVVANYDGCYDFAVGGSDATDERAYYDREYEGHPISELTTAELKQEWFDDTLPWRRTLLDGLGLLSGKRVLLLGNGTSSKELYFVHLGAHVVVTDLSIAAMRHAKAVFKKSELGKLNGDAAEFHAADALHLPFPDKSFDIIYASAFVHHLSDLEPFFKEVGRCLRDDGRCRFLDEAYSPLWQKLKLTWLRPLMKYSHRKLPRSPEDNRATLKGGYEQGELLNLGRRHGFRKLVYVKESFFLRLCTRHYGLAVGWNKIAMRVARPLFFIMKWLDKCLSDTSLMKANWICLTWGFDK